MRHNAVCILLTSDWFVTFHHQLRSFAQAIAEQSDVLLQFSGVFEQIQRRRVDGLVLGALRHACAQQMRDGSVHYLLPALKNALVKHISQAS